MITKQILTVKEIQKALYKFYKEKNYKYFSFNTFGTGDFEADAIFIHPENNFSVEFEIKRSKADYLKDFKKKNKHELLKTGKYIANQFYFVCERGVLRKEEIPQYAGLITIEKIISYKEYKKGNYIRKRQFVFYDLAVERKAKVMHQNEFPSHLIIKILTTVMNSYLNDKFQSLKEEKSVKKNKETKDARTKSTKSKQ